MNAIRIEPCALAAMRAHAVAAMGEECCGLLLGRDDGIEEVRPAPNVHPSPATHFEIDPQALIDAHRAARAGGPELIGYYHSHPRGPAEPSATDRAMAAGDGRVWAIIGKSAISFWRDGPGGFTPLAAR